VSPPLGGFALLAALASPQELLHVALGNSPQDFYGRSVCALGDVNGDGVPDYAVGVLGDNQRGPQSGTVKVLSGKTHVEILNLVGLHAGDRFGTSLSSAGDVDCDGTQDILVGAPGGSTNGLSSGSAYVFSGRDAVILYSFQGSHAGDELGESVALGRDIDGDGIAELILGAPGASSRGPNTGLVRVHSGADASILYVFHGDEAFDRFGCSVAGPGDLDGDGHNDLLVGACAPLTRKPGYACALSGADASYLYRFGGIQPADGFGVSVAGVGDLDRDGCQDVLVGAFLSDENGFEAGSAQLFSGRSGLPIATLLGDSTGAQFGTVVAGAGDVNGDGVGDFVVGAPEPELAFPGYARVFSGADRSVLATLVGSGPGYQFGVAAAGIGDVTGDGRSEVLIGAWADGTKGCWTGSASLWRL
jgi:FG-GAP repeat protein